MRRLHFTAILIILWLLSFLFCLFIPILRKNNIPDVFPQMIKESFDTFGPSLAAMVAFVFAKNQEHLKDFWRGKIQFIDVLALLFSVIYLGIFDTMMLMYAFRQFDAVGTIELFQQIRPYVAFLVTGVIAYYFVSEPSSNKNA